MPCAARSPSRTRWYNPPVSERPKVLLAGASVGNPDDPHALNGVPGRLYGALESHFDFSGRVDVSLTGWQRPAVAAATFRWDRTRWRERYWKSIPGFELQSRNSRSRLRALPHAPGLVIQLFGLFQTRGFPYVVYTDWTHQLSREHWPDWSPFGPGGAERWYRREGRAYRDAEHVFATSTLVADSIVDFYGAERSRVSVVGAGANFNPPERLPERPREPVVLFVGREWVRKGGDRLVEAFAAVRERFPGAVLRIVGTDEAPEGEGIELLGTISDRDRMAELYAGATVFCLPSRAEPFALSISEAMAHGLPCVVTSVGGLAEVVVDGETGLVVPPDDAPALAAALLTLLESPELAEGYGRAGVERVRSHLSWDRVGADMAATIQALAIRPGAGG